MNDHMSILSDAAMDAREGEGWASCGVRSKIQASGPWATMKRMLLGSNNRSLCGRTTVAFGATERRARSALMSRHIASRADSPQLCTLQCEARFTWRQSGGHVRRRSAGTPPPGQPLGTPPARPFPPAAAAPPVPRLPCGYSMLLSAWLRHQCRIRDQAPPVALPLEKPPSRPSLPGAAAPPVPLSPYDVLLHRSCFL